MRFIEFVTLFEAEAVPPNTALKSDDSKSDNSQPTQAEPPAKKKFPSGRLSSSARNMGQYNMPYRDGGVFIIEPQDADAAKYWALYTEWEIAKLKDEAAFEKYVAVRGQPWIICIANVRGPHSKFLMHPTSASRELLNYKNHRISFHNTLAKFKNLRMFIKNSLGGDTSALKNVSNDHLESINELIQQGIKYLAQKAVPSALVERYENWIRNLAEKTGHLNDDDTVNLSGLYHDPNALETIKSNRLAHFFWVVDTITNWSVDDLRIAADRYITNQGFRGISIREIDEVYSWIISEYLGTDDRGLSKDVKELVTVIKGPPSAAGTDYTAKPDRILGTFGEFTVYVKKAEPEVI